MATKRQQARVSRHHFMFNSIPGRDIQQTKYITEQQHTIKSMLICSICLWGPSFPQTQSLSSALDYGLHFDSSARPRSNKDAAIEAAKAQYETRGSPMQSTGWSPAQVHMFTKWQLSQYAEGKIRKSALGGFAWLLPKKGSDGKPGDLPGPVQSYIKSQSKDDDDDDDEEAHQSSIQPLQ